MSLWLHDRRANARITVLLFHSLSISVLPYLLFSTTLIFEDSIFPVPVRVAWIQVTPQMGCLWNWVYNEKVSSQNRFSIWETRDKNGKRISGLRSLLCFSLSLLGPIHTACWCVGIWIYCRHRFKKYDPKINKIYLMKRNSLKRTVTGLWNIFMDFWVQCKYQFLKLCVNALLSMTPYKLSEVYKSWSLLTEGIVGNLDVFLAYSSSQLLL